jgi:hypothetical protein
MSAEKWDRVFGFIFNHGGKVRWREGFELPAASVLCGWRVWVGDILNGLGCRRENGRERSRLGAMPTLGAKYAPKMGHPGSMPTLG